MRQRPCFAVGLHLPEPTITSVVGQAHPTKQITAVRPHEITLHSISISRTTKHSKQETAAAAESYMDGTGGSSWEQLLLPRARVAPSSVASCRLHGVQVLVEPVDRHQYFP